MMITVQLQRRLLTVEEYHKMIDAGIFHEDDRIELINGEIIETSPIGSEHAGHVNRINKFFNILLGEKALLTIQNPISIGDTSEPEPDIVVAKPSDHFYSKHHPTPDDIYLIIEVADSSVEIDREIKLPLYAEAGIPEYWIVNLVQSQIEVYRSPQAKTYRSKETINTDGSLYFEPFDLTRASLKIE